MQQTLSHELETTISGLVANYSIQALTTHLKNLNISINYLSLIPKYDSEVSLSEFMITTCNFGTPPEYLDGQDGVKVKHVLHVWKILKYAQTNTLMHNQQVSAIQPYHN